MKKSNIGRDMLENLYVKDNLSAAETGKKLGVSASTVQNYLHKYGFKIKGPGFDKVAPRIIFSDEQYEFFDGLIASDGCIVVKRKKDGTRIGNNQVSCAFKHKEFAEYIKSYLDFNSTIGKIIGIGDRYLSGQCIEFLFIIYKLL